MEFITAALAILVISQSMWITVLLCRLDRYKQLDTIAIRKPITKPYKELTTAYIPSKDQDKLGRGLEVSQFDLEDEKDA